MFNRVQAKERAKRTMSSRLSACVGADMLATLLNFIPLALGASKVGVCTWYLEECAGKKPRMSSVLEGFAVFSRAIMGYIWYYLFMFLWTLPSFLFFIIGGIITSSSAGVGAVLIVLGVIYIIAILICKGAQYDYLFFYMAKHPDKTAKECFDASAAVTKQYIGAIIVMRLSFIGWNILNVFTFSLLSIFYITPYINLTMAELYMQMFGDSGNGNERSSGGSISSTPYGPRGGAQPAPATHAIFGLSGMYSGASFELAAGQQVCIGRDPAYCQIVISSGGESVSRRHCLVRLDPAVGCFYVTDYSSNGTFLDNGTRLSPNIPTPLDPGSVIILGSRANVFRLQ